MKEKNRTPIIIDCDPGADDALALILLYKHINKFDVRLLCSTAGNTPIEKTTRNLQFFAKYFFKGVKVAKGQSNPLIRNNFCNAEDVHGSTGLGDFDPGPQRYSYKKDSVVAMYETLSRSKEPITILTLGPLTNIAKLLINYPTIKPKIKEIYSMIGSITGHGNITKYAEFNSYFDPEAFDLVVKSEIPITFNTIELGENAYLDREPFLQHKSSSHLQSVIKTIIHGTTEVCDYKKIFLYDINTVMALIKPELYDFVNCNVRVYTDAKQSGKCVMTDCKNSIYRYQVVKNYDEYYKVIIHEIFSVK